MDCYRCNGKFKDDYDIGNAFEIVTGRRPNLDGSDIEWEYFLNHIAFKKCEPPTIEELISNGNKIKAIRLIRDKSGCDLRTAKIAVDNMIEKMGE